VTGLAIGAALFSVLLVVRLFLHKGLQDRGGVLAELLRRRRIHDAVPRDEIRTESSCGSGGSSSHAVIALHACVISAVAVALATRLTLVQAAIGTGAFFVVGHASGALVAPSGTQITT